MGDTNSQSEKKEGKIGKAITTLGLAMLAMTVVLMVAGAFFGIFAPPIVGNVLGTGGLALAVIGWIMWRLVKI